MAFMVSSLDDDPIAANARVWDFVMPPKSWWTIPLSSERLICEIFQAQAARRICLRLARMKECGVPSVLSRRSDERRYSKRCGCLGSLFFLRRLYVVWSS